MNLLNDITNSDNEYTFGSIKVHLAHVASGVGTKVICSRAFLNVPIKLDFINQTEESTD